MINFKNLWAEGDPDYFDIYDGDTVVKGLNWRDEDALPFIFQGGKIYIGGSGRAHGSCRNPDDGLNDQTFAAGRIWFPNNNTFPYYVISFWYQDFERTIDTSLLDQFLARYNIDKDKVLVVSFEDDDYSVVYKYNDWHFKTSKANEKQREHRAMHLMNANDKRDATYNFRKNRDSAQSKKLTNAAGDKQMTMAQYKNLIYQENKNMSKKLIRLTESDLHRIIRRSVNKVLRESEESASKEKKEIFTIDAFAIESEHPIDEIQYQGATYYSVDEAIDAARNLAKELIDYDETVMVTVYGGEYETNNGDVFGEPIDIYSISNKDRRTTAITRRNCGYSSDKVDEYATEY